MQKVHFTLLSLLFIALTFGLGFEAAQSEFVQIIGFYFPFFLAYIWVYQSTKEDDHKTVWLFLGLGILLRGILLFALPNLSDDVYRFIWDGRLLNQGINPFSHLPSYYIDNKVAVNGIHEQLYQQLNSPNYFTIYPPVCQGTFALACWLFPTSIFGSAFVMKLMLFLCEVGSILLLPRLLLRFQLPIKNALLYALNPLIIIELVGNLHFEAAMVFFLLLSLWLMVNDYWKASAFAMALSIASKLLPLIFLPFLIKRLGWKGSFQYFAIVGITLLILFLPLFDATFISNFGDSLNLYFQKFEFNASVYYLLRWVGFQVIGYNLISVLGPSLALCVLIGVCGLAFFEKDLSLKHLPFVFLVAICFYLASTTTVHPWYVALPLVLCVFTRFRFPVLWSGLIMLTYINYSYEPYLENLWVVGLEYVLVGGYLLWEHRFERIL